MNINDALQLNDERPATFSVRNTDKTNLLAIGLKKGQVLKRHISPIPAFLVVLRGKVLFDMEGAGTEIPVYGTIEIPVNVPHEVTGVEESVIIVFKEKN